MCLGESIWLKNTAAKKQWFFLVFNQKKKDVENSHHFIPFLHFPKETHEKHTMWGPQTIAKLVYNSNNYMVCGTQISIVTGANLNQLTSLGGATLWGKPSQFPAQNTIARITCGSSQSVVGSTASTSGVAKGTTAVGKLRMGESCQLPNLVMTNIAMV